MVAKSKKAAIVCLVVWAIFVSVYVGVMVGIWKKLFDIDWHDSQCVVTGIKNYEFPYATKYGTAEVHYSNFAVKVMIDGVWAKGFACGTQSPHSATAGSPGLNDAYPYSYGPCPNRDVCGTEVIQPTWYCSDCKDCDEYLTGEQEDCKWTVIDTSGSAPSADEWPLTTEIEAPRLGSSYVQVVLGTEVYYPKGEFITLQVFGGLGIVLLPFSFFCSLIIAKRWKS